MLVCKTRCHTDWKSRPDHTLKVLSSTDTLSYAKDAIEADICKAMAEDLVRERKGEDYDWQDDGEWERLVEEHCLLSVEDLEKYWKTANRWKMGGVYELVWTSDEGDRCTIVYLLHPETEAEKKISLYS